MAYSATIRIQKIMWICDVVNNYVSLPKLRLLVIDLQIYFQVRLLRLVQWVSFNQKAKFIIGLLFILIPPFVVFFCLVFGVSAAGSELQAQTWNWKTFPKTSTANICTYKIAIDLPQFLPNELIQFNHVKINTSASTYEITSDHSKFFGSRPSLHKGPWGCTFKISKPEFWP